MKFKKLLWIIVLILLINTVVANDVEDDCDFEGYFYKCTGTLTGTDYDGGQYGVEFDGVTLTITEDYTGLNGDDVEVVIASTFKVKIIDSSITITGGPGQRSGTAHTNGGTGGDAVINISATQVGLFNSSLSATGGAGGEGRGDAGDCRDGGRGGASGAAIIRVNSNNLTSNDTSLTTTSGLGGNGDLGENGGAGSASTIYVNASTQIEHTNFNISANGGDGGEGEGCEDGSHDTDGDGGSAGTTTVTLLTTYGNGADIKIAMAGGDGGDGDAVADDCGTGGSSGGIVLTVNVTNYTAKTEYDVDATTGDCGGVSNSCDSNSNLAGDAGDATITFYATSNADINNSDFAITGTTCTANENNGGDGGSIAFTVIGKGVVDNSNYTLTAGAGGAGTAGTGNLGGAGGTLQLNFTGSTSLEINRTKTILTSGNGGAGDQTGGNAGLLYLEADGTHVYFIDINNTATGGTGGAGTTDGYGGYADIYSYADYNYIRNSKYVMTGGAGDNTAARGRCGRMYMAGTYFQSRESNFTFARAGTNTGAPVFDFKSTGDIDFQNKTNVTRPVEFSGTLNLTGTEGHLLFWNFYGNLSGVAINATDINLTIGREGTQPTEPEVYGDDYWNATIEQYYIRYHLQDIISHNTSPLIYNYTTARCRWNITYPETDVNYYGLTYGVLLNVTWLINDSAFAGDYMHNVVAVDGVINYTDAAGDVEYTDFNVPGNLTCIITAWNVSSNATINKTLEQIEYEYPYNLRIDIGADGTYEYNGSGAFTGILNDQAFDRGSFNKYLQQNCSTASSYCMVPIAFSSDSNGTVNVTNISIHYGSDNTTAEYILVPFILYSNSSGNLEISGTEFDYNNLVANLSVVGHTSNESQTLLIMTRYSRFNISLPRLYTYMDFVPETSNSRNVTPLGQTSTIPIHNITTDPEGNYSMELRVRLYSGKDSCTGLYASNSSSNVKYFNFTDTSTWFNITEYMDTNMTIADEVGLWYWADLFSCSGMYLISPQFYYESKCSDCVKW